METLICVNVVALVDPTIDAAKECANGMRTRKFRVLHRIASSSS